MKPALFAASGAAILIQFSAASAQPVPPPPPPPPADYAGDSYDPAETGAADADQDYADEAVDGQPLGDEPYDAPSDEAAYDAGPDDQPTYEPADEPPYGEDADPGFEPDAGDFVQDPLPPETYAEPVAPDMDAPPYAFPGPGDDAVLMADFDRRAVRIERAVEVGLRRGQISPYEADELRMRLDDLRARRDAGRGRTSPEFAEDLIRELNDLQARVRWMRGGTRW